MLKFDSFIIFNYSFYTACSRKERAIELSVEEVLFLIIGHYIFPVTYQEKTTFKFDLLVVF
jgi:hypothetical protein